MGEGPAKWRFLQSRWAGRQAGTSCLQTLERPRPVRGWPHPSTVDPGPGGSASDRGHRAQPRPCGRRGRRWQWALPAAGQGRACTPLPTPPPRPRAGCAPRGFGHAPLTSDDSSGPRPGDQSALSGTAKCGAGRPQPPRACGLGGSAPSQLSGHTAQPPTNPSQNEAAWRQRPRAGGRLCVRQAEARTARPPGAVGCWLGKVLSVPHTYGQGDRPAPSAQRAYNGHWPSGQREAPQTHKGHADELGALLGEARVPLRGPLGVAAAGWAEQASVSSSPPPGRRSYFSIL